MAQARQDQQDLKTEDRLATHSTDCANTSNNNNNTDKKTSLSRSNRVDRSSIRKLSSQSSAATTGYSSATPTASSPAPLVSYQPSKVFVTKCKAESESLLESIQSTYHDEIKKLYNDEQLADIFVEIGEEFKKPLHRCLLAGRAFKLYSALKAFKSDGEAVEQDIIVSDFQNKLALFQGIESQASVKTDEEEEIEKTKKRTEALSIYHFILPETLISPDLFLNFARRLYLNTDLAEEEIQLQRHLVDWLKQNRPELIKPPPTVKCSPDHRESFRTVQPDYQEQLSVETSGTMSPPNNRKQMSSGQPTPSRSSVADDELEDSQATSLTGSLLTRTETFELIPSTKHHDSEIGSSTPASNKLIDLTADDDNTTGGEDVDSETSQSKAYTPTTRTGLKPKTFTTPVDARQRLARANQRATAAASNAKSDISGVTDSSPKPSASKSLSTTTPRTKTSRPLAAQKSTTSPRAAPVDSSKTKATIPASKMKHTLPIARAHPISMERSQSPGTSNLIKGSPKNFIAANKRLVAQIEAKRLSASPSELQQQYESEAAGDVENDTVGLSEFSWQAFETPINSDKLVAQMDKFALVSLSALADCLSKIFVGEILTDAMILVREGKHINAHKCILAARSAYLNDLINQQTQTESNSLEPAAQTVSPSCNPKASQAQKLLKIDLTEFSYNTVYFSVLHIYSGVVKVPDDLDLGELTKLSHLLHVSTLKQVCQHNLRMNYCHFFHKPCQTCCIGVLKTLPLAWRYDYTDMYSKCLQWIGSHFSSIFSLREFAELKPSDLIEECYSATMSQLTPDNIISRTVECQKLLKNLPRVKWTESIICLVGRLLEDFCHYVADNYEKILQSESFMNLGKSCWECEVLEENLLAAMNHLKPDSGCKTLIQLHKIECSIESYCEDPKNVSESFANLISKMRKYCERYLLKEATAVVNCGSWRLVNPALQKRIKDQAIIASDFDEPTRQLTSKPKLTSVARSPNAAKTSAAATSGRTNESPGGDRLDSESPMRTKSPLDSRAIKSPSTTYLPPPKNKTAAARHLKVMK